MTRGSHRFHPYAKAKRKPHFTFGSVSHMSNVIMDSEPEAKRARTSEARMIPGLGPLENGFPNSIITNIRYCEYLSLTSTLGGTGSNVFRANGIFDPDYTSTGHQAMFRDAYAGVYDYYTVLGSKITVTYQSRSSTVGFIVGLQTSDTPTLSSSVTTWMEQNNGVHALIGNANTGSKTLFATFSPQEQLGSDTKDDNSSLTSVGSDPSSGTGGYYYGVLVAAEDAASTVSCTCMIEIEYTVKFATLAKRVQD